MKEVVNLHDAKSQLAPLTGRPSAGKDSVVMCARKPMAHLMPEADASPRQPGLLKGLIVPDALFAPLPASELQRWG